MANGALLLPDIRKRLSVTKRGGRRNTAALPLSSYRRPISLRAGHRVSLRGRDAGDATSSSFSGLWLAARCTSDRACVVPPHKTCTPDLHDRPSYDSRDGENHRPVLVCLLGAAVRP